MENFKSFGLPTALLQSLDELQFNTPTPIQAQVIPIALEGKDILGTAQTGTGKTGAFGIPLATHLLNNPNSTALVMAPTRELAVQVMKMLDLLLGGRKSTVKSALLIGGESIYKQLQQVQRKPRLIVGTPGRINDHLLRNSIHFKNADFLVLDETDRMLDMGFVPQIDAIIRTMPQKRQTLLFSATLPKNIVSIADRYMKDPVRIAVGAPSNVAANIQQDIVYISETEKHTQLTSELDKREGSIIVFVKTKMGAERIAKKLRQEEHSADAIHGNLNHRQRERAISAFRSSKYRIMVATDVAARGLDIDHVKHVINYDLPQCAEDYIHRIGRTARAGASGSALCFVTPSDKGKWNAIHRLMNPDAKHEPGERRERRSSGYKGGNGGGFKARSSNRGPESDSPFGDKPWGGRPSRGKFSGDRDNGERSFSDRPARARPVGDSPFGDKPFGGRPPRGKPAGDRPFGGDKPFGDRPAKARFAEGKSFGDRSPSDRPSRGKPAGERSFGKPFNGNRSSTTRPSQGNNRGGSSR
jgi:ATP-dependent RNA helicase DeaD